MHNVNQTIELSPAFNRNELNVARMKTTITICFSPSNFKKICFVIFCYQKKNQYEIFIDAKPISQL